MKYESKHLVVLCLAAQSLAAQADALHTSNPHSPYPPGCLTTPLRDLDLNGDGAAHFYSGNVRLDAVLAVYPPYQGDNAGEAQLNMYRVGCAEPGRSVIVAEFSAPDEGAARPTFQLHLPLLRGDGLPFHVVPFQFKSEPNAFGPGLFQYHLTKHGIGDYNGGWQDARGFTWRYVLDVDPSGIWWGRDFLPEYYNRSFALVFIGNDGNVTDVVDVPATAEVLETSPSMPLSGRLAGNWVEEGTVDQGFLLSFSSLVPPAGSAVAEPGDAELTIFLSWFTFDSHGDMLWLTGAATFAQGDDEVLIPIERITQGEFLGGTRAARADVGQLRLEATNCNRLDLEYELDGLGLGSGTMQLQRLFALEIAGYPCRDYKARAVTLAALGSN